MPSASQTRRRELARLKARREAERRRARRRRALILYGSIGVVLVVLAVVGGLLRTGDKPAPKATAATGQDARTDVPTAPAAVACGGTTPPKVNRPKLDRAPKSLAQPNQHYEVTLTTSCGPITL
jgi:peptidyl-prolyl cis-trans isomerase B (cyclophilin B)